MKLIHAITRMNLESTVSERRQFTKDHVLYDCIYVKCSGYANLEKDLRSVVV